MSSKSDKDDKDGDALPVRPQPTESTDRSTLPEEIRELLDELPEGELERVTKIASIMVSSHHEGPLPDGTNFEHYERVLPGAAKEIVEMAKKEQIIKETVLNGRVSNDRLRLSNDRLLVWVLMVAAGGMIGVAGLAVWLEQPYVAMFLTGLSAVLGISLRLIGALTTRKRDGKSD